MSMDNIRQEIASRMSYNRSLQSLEFLLQMNDSLHGLDSSLRDGVEHEHTDQVGLMVFGLYRSGTSLLYQVLASCLDLLYPNNLVARFWKVPQVGFMLSHILDIKPPIDDFSSDYGKTQHPGGAHEYSYFWRSKLGVDGVAEQSNSAETFTDGGVELRGCLYALMNRWGKSLLFKNVLGANRMDEMDAAMGRNLWIYIDRDLEDVAISHHHARLDYFGNLNAWWGLVPPGYEDLSQLSPAAQIACQVHGVHAFYAKLMCGKPNVVKVQYRDLCNNPAEVIEKVRRAALNLFMVDIPTRNSPPPRFEVHHYDWNRPEYSELLHEVRQT